MAPRLAIKASAASSAALLSSEETPAAAARPRISGGALGEAGSAPALQRLNAAIADLKAIAVQHHLQTAIAALRAEKAQEAAEAALKALEQDDRCGFAWYLLAIARDKAGDWRASLQCYEAALQLIPDLPEVANDLGRLAFRMGMKPIAEQLFRHYLAHQPDSTEGLNNLACALRDQSRYVEAIDVLKAAIGVHAENGQLWNTLGTILSEQGEFPTAVTFFDEALRCQPELFKAQYNRGNARHSLGDSVAGLVDCEAALAAAKAPDERAMMSLARATMMLVTGRVGEGWDAYEARLDPHYADVTHFLIDRPRWTPEADIAGRTLLLVGEQGLGDEVLFSSMLPDVIEALGPNGRLILALEPRLVPLFRRAFPEAVIGEHRTFKVDGRTVRALPFIEDWDAIDLWAPLASPLRRFRRSLDAFPPRPSFLKPDPERVAHWREMLAAAPPGLKAGLLWKSLKLEGARLRFFSPFEQWAPVLATSGVAFVNLQYGECDAEIAEAKARFGVDIWTPPGIDLKNDLDDVAALCSALDVVLGPANATSNIAAACGAPVWLISMPGAWPRLGTTRYPWYDSVRVFLPAGFNQWDGVMAEVAAALAEVAAKPGTEALPPG